MTDLDRSFLGLSAVLLLLCGICLMVNQYDHQFQIVDFPNVLLSQHLLLLSLPMYGLGFVLYKKYQSLGFFLKAVGMIYGVALLMLCADTAVFTTPFVLQDPFFNALDKKLGFNLVSLMQHIRHYPKVALGLEFLYFALLYVVKLLPLILAALQEETAVYRFSISFIISCILGFTIYYFLPTTAPADVISTKLFNPFQYHLVAQFQQIHTHQTPQFSQAGLIGFPSFHTIWAILLAYTCWSRKKLLYGVSIFSFLVIVATLASGWHFLSDIIGGVLVAFISIFLTEKFFIKWKKSQTRPR